MTLKKYFQKMNLIVLAMALGVIIFAMLAVYLNGDKPPTTDDNQFSFYAIAIVLFVWALFGGDYLHKKIINEVKNKDLSSKLNGFKSATIIRLALFEGTALFSTIIYLLNNDIGFLLIAAICIFSFRFLKPTQERLMKNVNFTKEELEQLRDPNYTFNN